MVGSIRTVLAAALLLLAVDAQAAVTARVDRHSVELNESFILEIEVDSMDDDEPDITPLEEHFYVGQGTTLSNTSIINGQISRSRTWTFPLMAREVGEVTIPPIAVGSERSDPITIVVEEARQSPPGEADVFITAEVDRAETYVQAQVLYRIKVYRAVATRQPALREPTFGGAEALVEPAGEEQSYEAILNGRAYNVNERVYAIFPQESGEITITPARFEARVLRDGRITGRKIFESEPQTITVQPMPPPPDDFPKAAWLPAKDLELREAWSRPPERLVAGEPITRSVTISALGLLETQIPAIPPDAGDGVNVYPDQPELGRRMEAGGIRGERTDQYALIGVEAGTIRLPPLALPWWDVEAGEWRVARLPERVLDVLPSNDPVPPPMEARMPAETARSGQPGMVTVQSDFWRRISELLAVVWLATVAAWWWTARPRREEAPAAVEAVPPTYRQQARVLKTARRAAESGDQAALRAAMLEWARLEWPERAPRSLGRIADRVAEPLASELRALARASYGPEGARFDGRRMAAALRTARAIDAESMPRDGDEPLPPLMPSA